MNLTEAQDGPDFADLLTQLDDTNEAILALGKMAVNCMENGNPLQKSAYGLYVLFEQQTADVTDIVAALREHRNRIVATAAAIDRAPSRASAPGKIEPDHPDYQAVIASNAALLAEMKAQRELVTKLELPINTEAIAEAAHVERDTVQRVIDQLLASKSDDDAESEPRGARSAR